jgi:hypothetical protein
MRNAVFAEGSALVHHLSLENEVCNSSADFLCHRLDYVASVDLDRRDSVPWNDDVQADSVHEQVRSDLSVKAMSDLLSHLLRNPTSRALRDCQD